MHPHAQQNLVAMSYCLSCILKEPLTSCVSFFQGEDMQNLPEDQGSVLFRLLNYPDGVPLENLSTDALQV